MRLRVPKSAVTALLLAWCVPGSAQAPTTQTSTPTPSDPQAIILIRQSLLALTGGTAVSDMTLNGTVTWIAGSTNETGTATLKAKGLSEAHLQISAGAFSRSETRNDTTTPSGQWVGADSAIHKQPLHNCFVPGAWFSPIALVLTAELTNTTLSYVGPETRDGVAVDHLKFSQTVTSKSQQAVALIQKLSVVDLYLDTASHLPFDATFNSHPENDAGRNIAVEIRFADYRVTNGIRVPFRIQRLLQNGLNLDLTVNSVQVNTGLLDSDFTLQ